MYTPQLLERIQHQLGLTWLRRTQEKLPQPAAITLPGSDDLQALRELGALGYVRGIQQRLDDIDQRYPACAGFIAALRLLVKNFQLDEFNRQLKDAEHECASPPA